MFVCRVAVGGSEHCAQAGGSARSHLGGGQGRWGKACAAKPLPTWRVFAGADFHAQERRFCTNCAVAVTNGGATNVSSRARATSLAGALVSWQTATAAAAVAAATAATDLALPPPPVPSDRSGRNLLARSHTSDRPGQLLAPTQGSRLWLPAE